MFLLIHWSEFNYITSLKMVKQDVSVSHLLSRTRQQGNEHLQNVALTHRQQLCDNICERLHHLPSSKHSLETSFECTPCGVRWCVVKPERPVFAGGHRM